MWYIVYKHIKCVLTCGLYILHTVYVHGDVFMKLWEVRYKKTAHDNSKRFGI